MLRAAEILHCSFIELWDHPERHEMMNRAFTLETALDQAKEVWREQAKAKAKLNA